MYKIINTTSILIAVLLLTSICGNAQNLQREEQELLNSLQDQSGYTFQELFPELHGQYSEFTNKNQQNSSNIIISQTGNGNVSLIIHSGDNNKSGLQQVGKENVYKMEIEGNNNTSIAFQFGQNNVVEDQLIGNNLLHQINQVGMGNTITQQGFQGIPLIIEQKGVNMNLNIKGNP